MDLPIYEFKIKEDDNRIEAVALVDFPAIGINYQTFSKHNLFDFKVIDEEEQVIMGPAMIPNLPIYRKDEKRGEYYAVFTKQTVKDLVQKFFREQRQSEFNEMHSPFAKIEGVYMYQSFITSEKMGILPPKGWEHIADGSWFIGAKVDNKEIWDKTKEEGVYKGFSIEGLFDIVPFKELEGLDETEVMFAEFLETTKRYFGIK